MPEKNFYEMLNVPRDATTAQIKAAYKEIARIYHPDSNFFDEILDDIMSPEQNELFQRITNAYNVLINPEERKAYDESLPPELADWDAPEPTGSGAIKTPANAFGTFGAVGRNSVKRFGEEDTSATVSEMLKIRRSPIQRLVNYLKSVFGS